MGKGQLCVAGDVEGAPHTPAYFVGCDRQRLATVCCRRMQDGQQSPPVCTAPTGALSVAWCVRGVLPAFPVGTKTSETRAIRIAMYINADVRKMVQFCAPTPFTVRHTGLKTTLGVRDIACDQY